MAEQDPEMEEILRTVEGAEALRPNTPEHDEILRQTEEIQRKLESRPKVQTRSVLNFDAPQAVPSKEEMIARMKQEEAEESQVKSRRDKIRGHDRNYRAEKWEAKMPPRWKPSKLDELPSQLKQLCLDWLEPTDGPRPNMYFTGPTGAGKSWTAYALARELYLERFDLKIKTVADLIQDLMPNKEGAEKTFERVKTCDILFLEDLGVERHLASGFTDERLHMLLDYRWQWELPTIVTSNVAPEGVYDLLTERTASRFFQNCLIVRFEGKDRRAE